MRYPLIAGNWKMNKTIAEAKEFAKNFKENYVKSDVETVICAPYLTLQTLIEEFKGLGVKVGAENCHYEDKGAFTGEVSIPMLKELGVEYTIIGHSERREYFNETDESVNKKIIKLLDNDMIPILCVGENLKERDSNVQDEKVRNQVKLALNGLSKEKAKKLVIAYEPIWAIGTGKTATFLQAEEMCEVIRNELISVFDEETADEIRILYGGSVTPDTITELMDNPETDGALVGGASLDFNKFIDIINF